MKSILFVDDDEVLARLSCEILKMHGYRAVCAYSGSDALEKFERDAFDILITDFRMDGMNGVELAREIRARKPGIPVIVVTGYGPIEADQDVNICLSKDALFPSLLVHIRDLLDQNQEPVVEQELRTGTDS